MDEKRLRPPQVVSGTPSDELAEFDIQGPGKGTRKGNKQINEHHEEIANHLDDNRCIISLCSRAVETLKDRTAGKPAETLYTLVRSANCNARDAAVCFQRWPVFDFTAAEF